MRAGIVARNYADTLLTLARRQGGGAPEEFGRALDEVATLLREEPRVRAFLESPSMDADKKKQALRASFRGRVPDTFLRFLLVVTDKGRERLFLQIAEAYQEMLDRFLGRVRAEVVLAESADAATRAQIQGALERRLGKTVLPEFRVDPDIVGGIIIRVEDQIIDGSVRTRLADLRRRLLDARIPQTVQV